MSHFAYGCFDLELRSHTAKDFVYPIVSEDD